MVGEAQLGATTYANGRAPTTWGLFSCAIGGSLEALVCMTSAMTLPLHPPHPPSARGKIKARTQIGFWGGLGGGRIGFGFKPCLTPLVAEGGLFSLI